MNEHVEPRTAETLNGFFQGATDPLQAARAQAWREVYQAEAAYPQVLRALRDQQQAEQNRGALA